MPNLFSPRADLFLRSALALGGAAVVLGGAAMFVLGNPDVVPSMGYTAPQPVMFSHEHHVGRLGLDCRYCHTGTEQSDFAGIPTAETCMNCHLQLYTTAPMLAPVREAWASGRPLEWNRVYRIPDFVRFSHKVHVASGVACVSCHGRLDQQPLTRQDTPLTMGWCLECHRHPNADLVDTSSVFAPSALPNPASAARPIDSPELLTNCSACHY